MNEIGSTIKNKVRDVKVHLKDAKFFAEDADLVIDNMKSLQFLVDDVLVEPDDIDSTSKITSALEVHQVKKSSMLMECPSFSTPKWFPTAYHFTGNFTGKMDPEVYNHPFLLLLFNLNNTCAACKDSFLGKED